MLPELSAHIEETRVPKNEAFVPTPSMFPPNSHPAIVVTFWLWSILRIKQSPESKT